MLYRLLRLIRIHVIFHTNNKVHSNVTEYDSINCGVDLHYCRKGDTVSPKCDAIWYECCHQLANSVFTCKLTATDSCFIFETLE